jgi:hypothetical protein
MAPSVPCRFHWLTWIGSHREVRCMAQSDGMVGGDLPDRLAATDRPMATLALHSGLWVRPLPMGGSPLQGRYPASEVNDGACAEKPDQLRSYVTLITMEICASAMALE